MTLIRFDPFRDIATLQDRLNRYFSEPTRTFSEDASLGTWMPAVDIFEKEDNVVLRAELPGMQEKDINVHVENGILTLRGERKRDTEVSNESFHRAERYYGTFTRTFALPTTVDVQKIRALYKDGLLEVVLPKAEAAKPKRIEIKTT